jgi:hypothetical protein
MTVYHRSDGCCSFRNAKGAKQQQAETAPAYKSTPLRPPIIMTTVLVRALVVALVVRAPA